MPEALTIGLVVTAFVIAVVVAALLFQRAPVRRRPREGPSAALLALARGDRTRALRILRSSLDHADDVAVETMLVLGHLLREHGEIEQALHVHHGVLGRPGLDPDQRRLVELQLVDDLLASGQNERAEARLAALDEHYEDDEILERRARALVRLQRYEDAVDVLQRRARLDDGDAGRAYAADGLAEIAREQWRQGQADPAFRTAELARSVHPERAAAYVVLGDVRQATGEPDEAVSTWIEGLRRAPGGGEMLLGRIFEATLQKGRLETLVDVMEALRAERPDDFWLWRATADLRLRRGDRDAFFALLEDRPPEADATLLGWSSWLRHVHGRGDETELRQLLSMLPDAAGPRQWRCPDCGREDDEPRVGCGRCGRVGALVPVVAVRATGDDAGAPVTIPGGRLQ